MSDSSPGISVSSAQASAVSSASKHIEDFVSNPFLPNEIWLMILRNNSDHFHHCKSQDDLTHLWTSVRLVCKQFKVEIEDIFRTQHLPKTVLHFLADTYYVIYDTFSRSRADICAMWDRTTLDHVQHHDFEIQLRFAGLVEKQPGKAVFKVKHQPNDHNTPETVHETAIFRHMIEKGGLGPMGEADKYRPSERRRLFGESEGQGLPSHPISIFEPEITEGIFVIQVRAGLNDCAVPGLEIDQEAREVSLDWRLLYSQFFGERRAIDWYEGYDGGLEYPWPQADQYPLYNKDPPSRDDPFPQKLNTALFYHAIRDYKQLCELSDENNRSATNMGKG